MYVLVYVDHYSDVYTSRLGGENFYCDYIDHSMSNRQNAHFRKDFYFTYPHYPNIRLEQT